MTQMSGPGPQSSSDNPLAPQKKRRGCLFYGCLTAVIVVLLALVALYYVASRSIRHVVETYGSKTALDISTAKLSIGDYQDLIVRLRAFKDQLRAGTSKEPLSISAKDLNAVLQHDPRFEGIPAAASLESGNIIVKGSLPLHPFGYKDLYLNGVVRIAAGPESSPPQLRVEEIRVGDKAMPQQVIDHIAKEDLTKDFSNDPELRDLWPLLGKLEITSDSILLYPK